MNLKKYMFVYFMLNSAVVFANVDSTRGREIAEIADNKEKGFVDSQATLLMKLRNSHGEESIRKLFVKTLEVESDGDKSLITFRNPADIKGTALLTYTHQKEDDDQWLYLPAIKRVKRIASSNKSGPFVGSEFAYEDLSSQEVDKYTYLFLRDDKMEGVDCFVIERYPVDKNSGYTKQVLWIDKEEYRTLKIDYYDRKNALLKSLLNQKFNQFLSAFWRPLKMVMVNHQTGKSTTLEWSQYKFRNGFSEGDFGKNSLKRSR